MVKIRINPVAGTDLQEIKDFLMGKNPSAAVETVRLIISKIEALTDFPEMGSPLAPRIKQPSRYRYVICEQYLIFYIFEDNIVSVQRVLHAKRNIASLLLDGQEES
ncbi:MAG TPA: type II toxin-antitoxin system mRNA interferase toxin, RelE/StbE family [Syntrophomonas sp.]|nr:type II toxin-antitoxin system mRNA interferase toxin, RelE/StbE family [Syntrophomonas sp.]